MQPTPARSPALKRVTAAPTRRTVPTISWPGTMGKVAPPHSSRTWWRSEWQTPQKAMSSSTSFGPGSRRSNSNGTSGVAAASAA
jgi:hypothetical protein